MLPRDQQREACENLRDKLQLERKSGNIGRVNLGNHPLWKAVMCTYPLSNEFGNPLEASHIEIVQTQKIWGPMLCPALVFPDGTVKEFSSVKIGWSEERSLRKRLMDALRIEAKLEQIHGNISPANNAFLYERDPLEIAEQLIDHEGIGWRLPPLLRQEFVAILRSRT